MYSVKNRVSGKQYTLSQLYSSSRLFSQVLQNVSGILLCMDLLLKTEMKRNTLFSSTPVRVRNVKRRFQLAGQYMNRRNRNGKGISLPDGIVTNHRHRNIAFPTRYAKTSASMPDGHVNPTMFDSWQVVWPIRQHRRSYMVQQLLSLMYPFQDMFWKAGTRKKHSRTGIISTRKLPGIFFSMPNGYSDELRVVNQKGFSLPL